MPRRLSPCRIPCKCCHTHNYDDDCRGPPSGSIACSVFLSTFVYYTIVFVAGTMAYMSTLLPLIQSYWSNDDGSRSNNLARKLTDYGGVKRETVRFSVDNSFVLTWCTPVGNSTFFNAPSDLPSILRHIEFYAWIGVYVKAPLISGMLYRCFMIFAEEREAVYFGNTSNSVLGSMRVITHVLECLAIYLFVGMHQDYDQPLLWLHRSALSLVIITSAFHIALTAISHYRSGKASKFIATSICLLSVLVSIPGVLESNYDFFRDHSCSLYVSPLLATSEYLLFGSLIAFHFILLPRSLSSPLEVALSFYDDHPNHVPDRFKAVYQPVVPHLTF